LALVAHHPRLTAREIASLLGITEWSVFRIISDLTKSGYLTRSRVGRSNVYEVDHGLSLRRPELQDVAVKDFLRVMKEINIGSLAEDKVDAG